MQNCLRATTQVVAGGVPRHEINVHVSAVFKGSECSPLGPELHLLAAGSGV
jgi:hypothetical protein